jgi:hypothetical protein
LSPSGKNMAPHAAAPDKQGSNCDECWASKIGTATTGKGRACKQKLRISLLHADDVKTAETVGEAMIMQISIPSMSVANFGTYVKVLAGDARENKLPTYALYTTITIKPHPNYQYTLDFTPLQGLEDADVLQAVMQRVRAEAKDLVLAPFPAMKKDEDEAPRKGAKKALPGQPVRTEAARGGKSRFAR